MKMEDLKQTPSSDSLIRNFTFAVKERVATEDREKWEENESQKWGQYSASSEAYAKASKAYAKASRAWMQDANEKLQSRHTLWTAAEQQSRKLLQK